MVVVTTEPVTTDFVSDINHTHVVSVLLNDGSRLVTSYKYIYRPDPTFANIQPRNHLIVCVTPICHSLLFI